jgi:phosphate/phosphite/phosphonate ABC transporter binding protein
MADLFIGRLNGQLGFRRLVVLKRLQPHLAADKPVVDMFLDEARLAAQIHHPNVVQIFDLGQSGDDYYIAMELIPGPSLEAIRKPVPWQVAVEIVAQACDGLHAAHELCDEAGKHLGLVHRDVSPGNLLVTANGLVKVVDFGVARVNESSPKIDRGMVIGKYAYMSPEHCRKEPLDRRADVFALGVILHQLITGRRIFLRESAARTVDAICNDPIPDPRETRPEVPGELVLVIRRALARDRTRRFVTAESMARALRWVVETSPRVVADYLESSCAVVLEDQARSIREASQRTSIDLAPPGLSDKKKRPRRSRLVPVALLVLLFAAACLSGSWLVRAMTSPLPLRLGLAPSFVRENVRRELEPFLAFLEQRLGRRLELTVDRSYDDLRLDLARGAIDLAILPHSQVVFARQLPTPPPVAAAMRYRDATTYPSIIVVRDNASIQDLAQLGGRRFCWVNRSSASGYLVPRLHLRDKGLDPDSFFGEVRHSGTHLAAVRDLLAGRCDGAAISAGWLHLAPKRGVDTSRLRVIAQAGRIPLDRVCVRPDLEPRQLGALRKALYEFEPRRDTDRAVLGVHFLVDGFAPPNIDDFGTLERALQSERIIPP